ncbi:MAG TPA: S8 family serine peptidase [Candidatus Cybelea sp.]
MRVVTGIAAVAVLTACHGAANSLPEASNATCRPHAAPSATNMLQSAITSPQVETAARLGLWPRRGPSVRICGDVGPGFARCQAWLRTDVQGAVRPNTPAGYAPSDLKAAYELTSDSLNDGGGQTVAIVDAYDDPNVESDLNVYRKQFGLPACTVSSGCFTKHQFTSQTNVGWAGEDSVDVEMISAICPNCKILLVEAASASIADLSSAEQYATANADYVSNSWSGNEGSQTYDADYRSDCGAIVASTGDHSFNSVAQWPAVLPRVVAVGGTSLTSVSPRVETAWQRAGSGCSKIYAKPSFQSALNTGCAMRADADISADADPQTGVAIYDTFRHRGWLVFGGTSVATPIVASIFALTGSTRTNLLGNLYAHAAALNDVVSGSNGACGPPLCVAGRGWDGPTGLGTANGTQAF